jgi:uncharacterized protein (TIGR02246 family)
VQALADRWASAYNKHDRAALGATYAEDARLMIHGATTISGRKAIEDFWAGDFEDSDPLTLLKVTNSVTGSDMLLVHGDYEVVSRKDGGELGGGRFAHLWTRTDRGEWRLDRDLWNEPFDPYTAGEVATAEEVQELAARWTGAYNQHDRAALQALYVDASRTARRCASRWTSSPRAALRRAAARAPVPEVQRPSRLTRQPTAIRLQSGARYVAARADANRKMPSEDDRA